MMKRIYSGSRLYSYIERQLRSIPHGRMVERACHLVGENHKLLVLCRDLQSAARIEMATDIRISLGKLGTPDPSNTSLMPSGCTVINGTFPNRPINYCPPYAINY